jgi:hypothetical protein
LLNNIKTIKYLINNYGFFNLLKKGFIYYKRKNIQVFQKTSSSYAGSLKLIKKNNFSNIEWNNIEFFENEHINKIAKNLSSLPANDKILITEIGEKVLSNEYRFFSKISINIDSINFNKDYLENIIWEKGMKLSKYSQFDKKYGDIKRVFEINRFQYLDALIPYFYLTEGKKRKEITDYIASFFDQWMHQNPYLKSVAWSCSQEISIRSIKLIFFFGFLKHGLIFKKSYVDYLFKAAKKVYEDIEYAVVQRNNHSITEACFLIIFGKIFDHTSFGLDCFSKGKNIIEKGIQKQFFEDGTYIQNSITYQRFAIQSIMLSYQFLKNSLSKNSLLKLCQVVEFFNYNIFDDDGNFPNYGPNDGAMLFNFGIADYRDLRPVTNLLSYSLKGDIYFNSHKSLIDTLFLTSFSFSHKHKKKDIEKINVKIFEKSSLFYLSLNKFSILACSTNFKNRYPSHCDGLHLDIWYNKKPVFTDSGSFEYYSKHGDEDFKSFLSTSYHNTIRLNKKDQIKKGPRFLWLTEMRSNNQIINSDKLYLQNFSYESQLKGSPIMTRLVDIIENKLIVKDVIQIKASHNTEIEQFWNYHKKSKLKISSNSIYFEEENLILSFSASCSFEIYIQEGFQSLYYGKKEPRTRIVCLMKNNVSTEINTTFEFLK